jgi:predicted glycosyltransferase
MAEAGVTVKVWVDITNSPHVLFFAPIIRRLEEQGHTVTVTARRYAQTEQLLRRYGILAVITGQHAGRSVPAKAVGLANRTAHLITQARGTGYDVAVGHNSNDLALAAWALGIPQLTMFDYEYAAVSHHLNVRLVDEVVVPEAIPLPRLAPYGGRPDKVFRYPGLKEEYYLYDFAPDPTILEQLGIHGRHTIVGVLRTAPEVTLYHRHDNPLFDRLVQELASRRGLTVVVIPRTEEQRAHYSSLGHGNLIVPATAVDGLSLIAAADFVIGAGGTMNREAVALGTPAYTMFAGRLGAVDERLISEGRLLRAASAQDVVLKKKDRRTAAPQTRDPQLFVDEILRVARLRSRRVRLGRVL